MNKFTNSLIHENSPYLLQHAHNPVNWLPWTKETLALAEKSDKLIIVSIGYSACHWCHVMEHESFENEDIANIMNENFICIKVDREERPDVDAVYMDSVQAMGIHGGWPLNVFLMPDAKPFYGGTYFKPQDWASICINIRDAFVNNRKELQNSAEGFTKNLRISESEKYGLSTAKNQLNSVDIDQIVNNLLAKQDPNWGGMARAPKFPMPNIWLFLTSFLQSSKNIELNETVQTALEVTLNKMAMGGIFDQIGGGFSRYSVDSEWFLPHFEKMLYDNAQLVSLYSKAYYFSGNKYYLEVVEQTIGWLKRELLANEGGFYSAQDADSEGVEGKFYTWQKKEILKYLPSNGELFCKKYQITEMGNWEESQNILWKKEPSLNNEFENELNILLEQRNQRIFPGLDDKMLCSWNGLMLKGMADAFHAIGSDDYLVIAKNTAHFIIDKFYSKGNLFHTYKNNVSKIEGFLEDYACTISGLIALYQVDFNEKWLAYAESLVLTVYENFYDVEQGFFTTTDKRGEQLIASKVDLFDNVIPSGNSIMAHNLYDLGVLLSREDFITLAKAMVNKMKNLIVENSDYLANWAALAHKINQPKIEIVIYGPGSIEKYKELLKYKIPHHYILVSENESSLDLFENRWPNNKTALIYICIDNVCGLPYSTVNEAVNYINTI